MTSGDNNNTELGVDAPASPLTPATSHAARHLAEALGGYPRQWIDWLRTQARKAPHGTIQPVPGGGWHRWRLTDLDKLIADELARRARHAGAATVKPDEALPIEATSGIGATGKPIVQLAMRHRMSPDGARRLARELLAEAARAETLAGVAA